ncbi:CHAT domain-containing protein [Amycolatopsis sp. cmx-8-4]|uniref:CHAT domain-containing protein n=1 Tax=Amycolatopsis sp. cmx-8-4 TaxID=2790947 RepID=UPI00397B84D4
MDAGTPRLADLESRLRDYESSSRHDLLLGPEILSDTAFIMARAWPAARSRTSHQDPALARTVVFTARLHHLRARHAVHPAVGAEDEQAAAELGTLAEAWSSGSASAEPRAAWDSHTSAVVRASWQTGADVLLEAVIAVWQAMAEGGYGSGVDELGRHVGMLLNLGFALGERFHRCGHTADLESAVAIMRAARRHVVELPKQTPAVLLGLSEALCRLYAVSGREEDLDEALEAGQTGIGGLGADYPDRSLHLYELAGGYVTRFARRGRREDIDRAIDMLRDAKSLTPETSAEHPARRSGLIDALLTRYQHLRDRKDLAEVIDLAEAVVGSSGDAAAKARANSDLAGVLLDYLAESGSDHDLRRAVDAARSAANEAASGDVNRPHYLTQLSLLLRMLFERTRSLTDLEEAIYAGRVAVRETPTGSPDLARRRSNPGFTLTLLAERTSDPHHLDAAVEVATSATRAIPAGHPDRPIALSNLAAAHNLRQRLRPNATSLDVAIEALREAVREAPAGHPVSPVFLSNLSVSLVSRYRRSGSAADRSEALTTIERALRECVPESPDQADYHYNLAIALELGQDPMEADPTLDARVLAAFRDAARLEVAPMRTRALAARGWAGKAAEAGDWEEALSAYAQAVSHAQAWAWHGAEREDTFAALSEVAGIANDAAAVAVRLGRLETALQLLEQGHGVAYSWVVGLNADRATLQAAHPGLSARVDRIRQALDAQATPDGTTTPDAAGDLRFRQNLARDWDEVVADVRRQPGFGDFLRPPRLGDLAGLATEGPIAVVNISEHRCDALLVTTGGIVLVPLPELTARTAGGQASLLTAALDSRTLGNPYWAQAERTAHRVLAWTWDVIVEPVTAALGFTGRVAGPTGLPRMWWYPTGVARFLPLHAAGRHPDRAPGTWWASAPTVLHRAKSSYLPTLGALARARCRPVPDLSASALIVAVPDAVGVPPLAGVSVEVDRIGPYFTAGELVAGSDATRAAVLERLPACHTLHFAGHGVQYLERGAGGALITHDQHKAGPVSMADIARLNLPHADLAFLSACETALGDAALADESVHVAGALHMAGFTHTVGTRWTTGDRTSIEVADRFYDHLRKSQARTGTAEHADIASALHSATIDLYRKCGHRPLAWAHYVHTGP